MLNFQCSIFNPYFQTFKPCPLNSSNHIQQPSTRNSSKPLNPKPLNPKPKYSMLNFQCSIFNPYLQTSKPCPFNPSNHIQQPSTLTSKPLTRFLQNKLIELYTCYQFKLYFDASINKTQFACG